MHGTVVTTRLSSRLLRGNVLGDPADRDVLVYLPPGYDEGARRYPTVMMLPGYASTHRSIVRFNPWRPNPVERFDALVAAGTSAPALLVLPDAMTRWGGSQFLDSPATGAYQSYLADEVIPHVDATFRTVPRAEGRAVVGTSSGGFGALRLVMDRPGLFAAAGSHAGDAAFEVSMRPMLTTAAIAFDRAGSPSAFAERIGETGPLGATDFDGIFVLAAAAAYSPAPDAPPPHLELPFDPATAELRPDVWTRWLAHDPLRRVDTSADALRALRLVHIDAGDRDEHGLHFAARLLATALGRIGATVVHEEFEGGHRGTGHRYAISLPRLVGVLEAA